MGGWCLFDQRVVFGKRKSIYCRTLIAECGMYLKMLQKLEFDLPRLSSRYAVNYDELLGRSESNGHLLQSIIVVSITNLFY